MDDCNNLILTYLNDYDLVIMKSVSKYYNKIQTKNLSIFENSSNTIELLNYYNITKFNNNSVNNTAKFGNLEVMKWLKDRKCLWNTCIFKCAADSGNLEVMKLLYSNGCPWNESTFNSAAMFGNLDNMKWLYLNKCPWDN